MASNDLSNAPLVNRPGQSANGLTILELAAVLGGLPPSETPANVPEVFHAMVRTWNEVIPEDRLERYRPLAKAISSAKSDPAIDTRRGWRAVDWVVHTFIAEYAELIGWPDEAAALRKLAPIVEAESLAAAQKPVSRISGRAIIVVEAAGALMKAPSMPLGTWLDRGARSKFASMAKDFGRAHTEIHDARVYPGYDALAFTGLRSVNMLVRWPQLQDVRCRQILPTMAVAEQAQMAATMGAERDRTEALTLWLCDSFANLVIEMAKMKPRSRKKA